MKSFPPSFVLVGGDLRQCYLGAYLKSCGYSVTACGLPAFSSGSPLPAADFQEAILNNAIVIGPIPFLNKSGLLHLEGQSDLSPETFCKAASGCSLLIAGSIPGPVRQLCDKSHIAFYDVMTCEALTFLNAEITAEGMLAELITHTPFILQNTKILILGSGCCGFILAQKLSALNASVTVCDISRNRQMLAASVGVSAITPDSMPAVLSEYRIIVNTVPSLILTSELLSKCSKTAHLFDLASAPGGIDLKAAQDLHLPVTACPGLPGKYAPETAAKFLGDEIVAYLHNLERR